MSTRRSPAPSPLTHLEGQLDEARRPRWAGDQGQDAGVRAHGLTVCQGSVHLRERVWGREAASRGWQGGGPAAQRSAHPLILRAAPIPSLGAPSRCPACFSSTERTWLTAAAARGGGGQEGRRVPGQGVGRRRRQAPRSRCRAPAENAHLRRPTRCPQTGRTACAWRGRAPTRCRRRPACLQAARGAATRGIGAGWRGACRCQAGSVPPSLTTSAPVASATRVRASTWHHQAIHSCGLAGARCAGATLSRYSRV